MKTPNLLDRVRKTAEKRKTLLIRVTGAEKWNYPSKNNHWGKLENVRADGTLSGTYDVEGHSWSDIEMKFDLNLLELEDLKLWVKDVANYVIDVAGALKDTFNFKRRWFGLDLFLSYAWETLDSLSTTKTYWAMTISSLDVHKDDMSSDIAYDSLKAQELELGSDRFNLGSSKYKKYLQNLNNLKERVYDSLSYEEVVGNLNKDCTTFALGMYALNEDPSIVYIDNTVLPYDLKDGYSDSVIKYFIAVWAIHVLGLSHSNVVDEAEMKKQ